MSDFMRQLTYAQRKWIHDVSGGVASYKTIGRKLLERLLGPSWQHHREKLTCLEATDLADWVWRDEGSEEFRGLKTILKNNHNFLPSEPLMFTTARMFGQPFSALQVVTPIMSEEYPMDALKGGLRIVNRATDNIFSDYKVMGPPPSSRWVVMKALFMDTTWKGNFKPVGGIMYYLGEGGHVEGHIALYDYKADEAMRVPFCETSEMGESEAVAQNLNAFLAAIRTGAGFGAVIGYTMMAVNMICNCNNVEIARGRYQSGTARKLSKRHRLGYKSLILSKLAREIDGSDSLFTRPFPEAMSVVRGHMKDYRDSEEGLFGKHRGIWWWGQHARDRSNDAVQEATV